MGRSARVMVAIVFTLLSMAFALAVAVYLGEPQ